MVSIRAHFDGKVLVPDEPVNLPANEPVRLIVMPASPGDRPLMELVRLAEALPGGDGWPKDGAAEHDHYLYNTPKREP